MIYSDLYSPAFSPLCIYLFNLFGFGNYQPSEHSWSLSKLHRKTIWHLFPNDFFVYHVTKKCSIAIGRFNLAGNSTSLPRFRFISHSAVNGVQTVWFGRTQSLHGFSHSRLENRDLLNATLNFSILWEIYTSYFSFSYYKYFLEAMSSFVFGNNVNREDAENLGPRRVKQANAGLTARNAPKRAALGSISNNIRVQPSRAAKVWNGKIWI